jgi:hypothetical protein
MKKMMNDRLNDLPHHHHHHHRQQTTSMPGLYDRQIMRGLELFCTPLSNDSRMPDACLATAVTAK